MNHHQLKIWPVHFENVRAGTKTFEIRKNDRAFQKGDQVTLNEYDPDELVNHSDVFVDYYTKGKYSGRKLTFKVGDVYPIDSQRVVFSLLTTKEGAE